MNISCDIITDLLPLYHDGVCNETSKKLVNEHISTCSKCKTMLERMNDNILDESIMKERENVLGNHMKNVKKQSLIQGLSIAMLISTVPPFVVNLATSGTLDWFFIVLSSVLLFGSLTMIPLLFEKNRWLWTLASSTVSLLLLLFVIDSYVKGSSWFLVAATSTALTVGGVLLMLNLFGRSRS